VKLRKKIINLLKNLIIIYNKENTRTHSSMPKKHFVYETRKMQSTLTRTLVRTRAPHFRGFLLLDLRQCALRLRTRAVFLFNPERSERVGRKYRVYNDGKGRKDIISARAG